MKSETRSGKCLTASLQGPLPRYFSRLSKPRLSFRPPRPTPLRDGLAALVNSLSLGRRPCQTRLLWTELNYAEAV